MQVDPTGFVIVCVICALLGFFFGWAGGRAEEREQGRVRDQTPMPTHPQYVAGFKAGHGAGRLRGANGVLVGPRWQEDMRARLNEATTHLQANRWTPAFQSVQDALGLLDAAGAAPTAPTEFKAVGKADFHMSAELDVCIGDELFIRSPGVGAKHE